MNIRPSVLLKHKGRFLFLTYDYPKGSIFAFPGGGAEEGETLHQTLERELMEELNLTIKIGSMLWVCEMMSNENLPQTLHLIFSATLKTEQEPVLNPAHTTASGFAWLGPDDIKGKAFYPNVGHVIWKEQDLLSPERNLYLGLCPDRHWA